MELFSWLDKGNPLCGSNFCGLKKSHWSQESYTVRDCLFRCCDVLRGVYNFCSWSCCGYIAAGCFASLLFVNNTSARDPPDVSSLLQTCGSCTRDTDLKPWFLRNPRRWKCKTWCVFAWLGFQEVGCQQMRNLYRYASLNDGDTFWEMCR